MKKWIHSFIDRRFKNDLTQKRIRRYLSQRRSVASLLIFIFLLILSLTAEMWANSKPIVLFYDGRIYSPVYQKIHPSVFGQTENFVTDYRELKKDPKAHMVWPLVEWDPFESNREVERFPSPPSKDNWFGTDDRGRDVMSRLLYGFRFSIGYALLVWSMSFVLGTLIGGWMGFRGGKVDLWGQRVVEIFDTLPVFLLLITLVAVFGSSLSLLVAISSIFGWMMISIYVRAEFLRLRKREFVEAARASGASTWRQILIHILPNALGPVLTFSPFTIAAGISGLAALDYLGFGLPPPTPSWGELLQQAQKNFTIAWWLAFFPSLALFITLVALNFIGEGVRTAFDPKSKA